MNIRQHFGTLGALGVSLLVGLAPGARGSTAYGSLNNFDCVNDTGVEAHGFEIELDDVRSRDVTYTYDYNHYGTPRITEDLSDPVHPKVFVRYAATRNSDGTWTAYTAIPSGPISPTDGHQFTDPSINFGGEHFGVGYWGAPTAVKYNWLVDDQTPAHNLVQGPPVYIATPVFTYFPPAPAQPVPQVQAVVVLPPPPVQPVFQFGEATWVKDIKTTTHNAEKVELVDLVDIDPDHPEKKNWANGEPPEVETEWRILQTEFGNDGNPKGELRGLPEDLPGGDEVITRRYEFYKYVGPIDAESGEAMADEVGPDGVHGVGEVTYIESFDAFGEPVEVTVDLSTWIIVGDFIGAQMSGFDVAPQLGLIDHVPDGEENTPYAERSVVISSGSPFIAHVSGTVPEGTTLDPVSGIFSGTPTAAGSYTFTVTASELGGVEVSKTYTVNIVSVAPPTVSIGVSAMPAALGTVSGGGIHAFGAEATVTATPGVGARFVNWTEGDVEVSPLAQYAFPANADRDLVAHFAWQTFAIQTGSAPAAGGTTVGGGVYEYGAVATVTATPSVGYNFAFWSENGVSVSSNAQYSFGVSQARQLVANFVFLPRRGDVDANGIIDAADLALILAARNQPASGPNDPRDLDHDGRITVLDARIEVQIIRHFQL